MTADVSIRNRNKAIGDQGANRRAEGVRAAVEEPHPADGDETERWLWEPEPIAYGASVLLGFGASSVRGWVLIKTFIPPAEPFCERPTDPIYPKAEGSINLPVGSLWIRPQLERELYLDVIEFALKFRLAINGGIEQVI